jgi:hypothetical protein
LFFLVIQQTTLFYGRFLYSLKKFLIIDSMKRVCKSSAEEHETTFGGANMSGLLATVEKQIMYT